MLLTACSARKAEDITGIWALEAQDTQVQAQALLLDVEAYTEELALADLDSLKYVKVAEFCEDGTYQFRIDAQGTKACVRSFFDGYFQALYEGRATLNEAYNMTFDEMTREEFLQFYADIYEKENYQVLLDDFAETAYDYEGLSVPTRGTYKVTGGLVRCTKDGAGEASTLKAERSGENGEYLILTYSDGEEIYTRVN